MSLLSEMDPHDLRELLSKSWMTHDAMWFAESVRAHGIEATNPINRAACRGMAVIEAKRLEKVLGIDEIRDFDDFRGFVVAALDITKPDFMDFHITFREPDVMIWDAPSCFAYDGAVRLGVIDRYECGILERLDGWFEALGVRADASPLDGCLRHSEGRCHREYRLTFSPASSTPGP